MNHPKISQDRPIPWAQGCDSRIVKYLFLLYNQTGEVNPGITIIDTHRGETVMMKHRGIFLTILAIFLALVCVFLFTGRAEASPAAPIEYTLTQPDGKTSFLVHQWGDEWNNGKETFEGYSIVQMADGWWVYAEPQADGLLGPALIDGKPRLVGIDKPGKLTPHLRPTVLVDNPNSINNLGIKTPSLDNARAPNLTNFKTLLLLAKFTDQAETYPATNFQVSMFSTSSSSVRKYYRENSYNHADILPAAETCGTANDGTTPWTLLPYIHPNSPGSTHNLWDVVKDVLTANDGCIDFASFDTNSNGYIEPSELIIVVAVAGYEKSFSDAYAPAMWAFMSDFSSGAPTLDGKVISAEDYGNFAMFGEVHRSTPDDMHQATIGGIAHEFGHTINWPDLYDTDGSSNGGVGTWSLMAAGDWNSTSPLAGDTPAHVDAWLKWYQGWLTPTEVIGAQNNVSIMRSEDNAVAYLLRPNPGGVDWEFYSHSGTGEFFLVENRQQTLYDAGLRGCGLLIWHIDESVVFDNHANANEPQTLVWLEQADGLNELAGLGDRGDAGDPWPGSAARTEFYNSSNPSSNLYDGSASSVAVHVDSTSCSSSMQADLTYPIVTVSNSLPAVYQLSPPTIFQGFEGGVFPPVGWTRGASNPYSWDIGSGEFSHSGSYYAHVLPDPAHGAQNEILLSPAFLTSGGTVSFYSASDRYYCYILDNCNLEIWVVKGSWDGGSNNDVLIGWADLTWFDDWVYAPATFDFTPYVTGGQTIRIAFRYVGKVDTQSAEILLDDIRIKY
jgi:M6 family metalloprotease-like protein